MSNQDGYGMTHRENRKAALMAASRVMANHPWTTNAQQTHDDVAEQTMELARMFERYIEEGRIPSDDR